MARPSKADHIFTVPGSPLAKVTVNEDKSGGNKHRVAVTDSTGQRVFETTRSTVAKALELADEQFQLLKKNPGLPPASSTTRCLDVIKHYVAGTQRQKEWGENTERDCKNVLNRWLRLFPDLLAKPWLDVRREDILTVLKYVELRGYPCGTDEYQRVGKFLRGLVSTADEMRLICRDGNPMRNVRYNTYSSAGNGKQVRRVAPYEIPASDPIALLAEKLGASSRPTGRRIWLAGAEAGGRFGEVVGWRIEDVPAPGTDAVRLPILRQVLERSRSHGGLDLDALPKHGRTRETIVDEPFLQELQDQVFWVARTHGLDTDDWDEIQFRLGGELLLPAAGGGAQLRGTFYRDIFNPALAQLELDERWPAMARSARLPICSAVPMEEYNAAVAADAAARAEGPLPKFRPPCINYVLPAEHYHFPWRHHAGRHAYVTQMHRRGFNFTAIAKAVGHVDGHFTEARYFGTDGTEDDTARQLLSASRGEHSLITMPARLAV